jgi:hypothetical protein
MIVTSVVSAPAPAADVNLIVASSSSAAAV